MFSSGNGCQQYFFKKKAFTEGKENIREYKQLTPIYRSRTRIKNDLLTLETTKETPPLLVWRALMSFPRVGEIRTGFL